MKISFVNNFTSVWKQNLEGGLARGTLYPEE